MQDPCPSTTDCSSVGGGTSGSTASSAMDSNPNEPITVRCAGSVCWTWIIIAHGWTTVLVSTTANTSYCSSCTSKSPSSSWLSWKFSPCWMKYREYPKLMKLIFTLLLGFYLLCPLYPCWLSLEPLLVITFIWCSGMLPLLKVWLEKSLATMLSMIIMWECMRTLLRYLVLMGFIGCCLFRVMDLMGMGCSGQNLLLQMCIQAYQMTHQSYIDINGVYI